MDDIIRNVLIKLKNKIKYTLPHNRLQRRNRMIRAIILMGEPEYENLGDHAIAYATRRFIETNCPNYHYIGVSENHIRYSFNRVCKNIKPDDVLLLQGGGNMGDLYPDQIEIRKKVIQAFPENKIIIMPQTIHFSGEKNELPDYYSNHQHLVLTAREKISYDIMQKCYNGHVILTPDIVFSLNKIPILTTERKVALVCIRNDAESVGNREKKIELIDKTLKRLNYHSEQISTVLSLSVDVEHREQALYDLFQKFQEAKVIITDRLHGMIIAAITKTPCVVLPTFNHKVVYCYEWIKLVNYIVLCKSDTDITSCIQQVTAIPEAEKSIFDFNSEFAVLVETILEDCKG